MAQTEAAPGTDRDALTVTDLSFTYGEKTVVDIERCQLARGASMAVIGPSGCGKTTFLHLLAGLLTPAAGKIEVLQQDIGAMNGANLDLFRGRNLGMVFQRLYLLPALSVRDNIALAQRLSRTPIEPGRIDALLEQLDLTAQADQKPKTLSQGQAQRVAIARALVHRPALVLADEPTSSLDDQNSQLALGLLRDTAKESDAALLIVTHDQRVRGQLDHEFEMGATP